METYQLSPAMYFAALEVINYGLWSRRAVEAPQLRVTHDLSSTAGYWLSCFPQPERPVWPR